jgi:antirestriction protein ArdC
MTNIKQHGTVYDLITKRIIDKLETGTIPWRKPWRGDAGEPRNLASKRAYRGINVFLLSMAGYESPYWLTFKQAKERGGSVCRGEKGMPVVLWRWREDSEQDEDPGTAKRQIPILRYYTVFNVAQCEGIDVPDAPTDLDFQPIAQCEDVAARMPESPTFQTQPGRAYYAPASDTVSLPPPQHFASAEHYYATLFHELGHATGHQRRLSREAVMDPARFGSHAYSKEELVAEMTAAYLCGHCAIDTATLDNTAAYIDSWLGVLRGDSRLVVHAAAQAQKAADWILGRTVASDE